MSLNNKRYALLASVPIEYLTRLDSAIRQSTTWSQGAEHRAIRDKILELCDSCKQYIFQESALFRSIYAGAPITPSQEIVLRQILRTTSGAFTTLHELLLFLPRESIRRELTDYCRSLFNKEYNSSQISLLLTSLFNAFEYSLDDVMQTAATRRICCNL